MAVTFQHSAQHKSLNLIWPSSEHKWTIGLYNSAIYAKEVIPKVVLSLPLNFNVLVVTETFVAIQQLAINDNIYTML